MEQVPIDSITQAKLESFIKQEEGDANDYRGWLATFITLAAVGMSLCSLCHRAHPGTPYGTCGHCLVFGVPQLSIDQPF